MQASIDGKMVTTQTVTQGAGFVGFGVGGFYAALFDDFSVMAGKIDRSVSMVYLIHVHRVKIETEAPNNPLSHDSTIVV